MRIHARTPQRPRSLDDALLPLVNVVFLLMIFFLSAGRLSGPRPDAVAPQSSRDEARTAAARVLELRSDGQLSVDGDVFADADLPLRAAAWQGTPLDVKAAGQVQADRVLRLMAVLRAAGVRELRLLTIKGGGG